MSVIIDNLAKWTLANIASAFVTEIRYRICQDFSSQNLVDQHPSTANTLGTADSVLARIIRDEVRVHVAHLFDNAGGTLTKRKVYNRYEGFMSGLFGKTEIAAGTTSYIMTGNALRSKLNTAFSNILKDARDYSQNFLPTEEFFPDILEMTVYYSKLDSVTCVPLEVKMVVPENGTELMPIISRDLQETIYGTYLNQMGNTEGWFYTRPFSHSKYMWFKEVDIIQCLGKTGYVSFYLFNQDIEKLLKAEKIFEKDGKYYDYDVSAYKYQVINEGLRKDVPEDAYVHIVDNLYVNRNYRLFSYDFDILNVLNSFISEDYEQTHRGDKVHSKNTLFMGGELEVEMSRKATITRDQASLQALIAMRGKGITVHDGSLTNGFEIVSVPATLNSHYHIWEELCTGELRKQLVSFLRPSCGLHIHMSKEAFSDYTLGKFITFINDSNNGDFIDKISGRAPNSYCGRYSTKVSKGKHRDILVDSRGSCHGKYSATNLEKPHTLEVRMFKGTLSYPSVMKAFEFCHALHRYVTFHSSHNKLGYNDFVNWFKDKKYNNRKSYPYLWAWMVTENYVEERHTDIRHGLHNKPAYADESTEAHTLPPTDKKVDNNILQLFRKSSTATKVINLK